MKALMTTKEAAIYLGYSEQYLRKSRVTGKLSGHNAPRHIKISPGAVRYKQDDLDTWVILVSEAQQ